MNKEDLMRQMAAINQRHQTEASRVQSKWQRDLNYYQQELRQAKVELPFAIMLSEVIPEERNNKVGIHGHTRETYRLEWINQPGGFTFILENIKANKKRPLSDCPDEILRDITPLLPLIIKLMASTAEQKLKEALSNGEIEVTEEDNPSEEELEKEFSKD